MRPPTACLRPRRAAFARFPARASRAFTLVEVLVTLGIVGITMGLLMPFFIFNLKSIFHGEQKLLINGDIRDLTNTMMENTRESNYFALYGSFYTRTTASGFESRRDSYPPASFSNSAGDGLINELDRLAAGESGDFLVLVFTRNNAIYDSRYYDNIVGNEPANLTQVTRLVAYWVAPNRNPPRPGETPERNALYRLDTDDFKPSPSSTSWSTSWGASFPVTLSTTTTLESLLPPATESAATDPAYAEIVINDLVGRTGNSQNFLNFANKTVVVQSRVLHGNRAKRVTNTYNFAITPRG